MKIRKLSETCIAVFDDNDRNVASIYFDDRQSVRDVEKRLSEAEALAWAKHIARTGPPPDLGF